MAIDGPAGSGKTTVARGVAKALGFAHIDTGSMYRALTWRALEDGIDPSDEAALTALARRLDMTYGEHGLEIDGAPVGQEIRSPRVNKFVSIVAAHAGVRRELVKRQRRVVKGRSAVVEGRDIGTVVCPDAPVKIFLTASATERARRRHREMLRAGVKVSLDSLKRQIVRRDALDSNRAVSPLAAADDAKVVDSTGRSPRQVIAEIVGLVREAQSSVTR